MDQAMLVETLTSHDVTNEPFCIVEESESNYIVKAIKAKKKATLKLSFFILLLQLYEKFFTHYLLAQYYL